MGNFKKDYMALQNAWNICLQKYLTSPSKLERMEIIDDWRDSLVDVKPEGLLALRTNFEYWEERTWFNECIEQLEKWKKKYPFEAKDKEEENREFEDIKIDRNYLRFKKIMQVIQDSGIGLGTGSGGGYKIGEGFGSFKGKSE